MPTHSFAALLRLSWRQLARDFRAGELRLLGLAVTLAVTTLTAVGFFADRLERGLALNARQLLGGDAVVVADHRLPPEFVQRAQALGLRSATHATFPSMARAGDAEGGASRLAAIKAVGDAYPLRGQLRVSAHRGGPDHAPAGAPGRGTVWVDPALLDALELELGDTLLLGDASFEISRVIVFEPDRGAGFVNFAPRVMLHEDDLAATGLVQPASRVTYRLAVASPTGDDARVDEWVRQVQTRMSALGLRGVQVETLEAGRPEMRQTLDRATRFLDLVALLAALLAAVAVAIASRDFAARRLDDCAMLRVLGSPQRVIAGSYLIEFGSVGLLAGAAGAAIGLLLHQVFVWLLAGIVGTSLPAPGAWPALFGLGVGLTLLLAFGLPPVLQLARVPPLRVMRRDVGALQPASLAVLGAGTAGFVALLLAAAGNLELGAIAVGGFAAATAVFALASWLAVRALRRLVPQSGAPRWLVLATRQLGARPGFAVVQVSSLAVGLLALTLLVLLRTDLIDSWRRATPAHAPNRFVINVQPDQGEAFRARLDAAGVAGYDWYPMFRGRLVSINDRPVQADRYAEARARRLVEREFNLSHSAQRPEHNPIVAGRWTPEEADAVSVEEGLAQTLGLRLGDTLAFDIAGTPRRARITSLRKVDWSSMRVNFFVIFPRAQMAGVPSTYIAAFRAPEREGFDNQLTREFPNITEVDVSASIAQVRRVLDQVARAVEFLFVFTLATGLVVLFAALGATREARAREFAIMRAMGASRRLLAQVQRAELLGVGALAGLLAALAAAAVGWALARFVFEFAWSISPQVLAAGTAAGALLALAGGWWSLREVLHQPVVQTLRRAAQE